MTFQRAILRFYKTPRGRVEFPPLGILDFHQADQPSFGRNQQACRFLSWRLIENHAADDARRIGVSARAPDLRLSSQIERQVEEAIFEVLDP
jgi:hypothetical protein